MSGVVFLVVLLGMWAFVLVPLVRHRNERADEIRSVARFSSALRVLSRGHSGASRSAPGMRQWVMPPRAGIAAARDARLRANGSYRGRPVTAPLSFAAARRRRVFLSLVGLVVATLLLTAVRHSLVPLQMLSDVLFVIGAYMCKWSADQDRARARRARRRAANARRADLLAAAPGQPFSARYADPTARPVSRRRPVPDRFVADRFVDASVDVTFTLSGHAPSSRPAVPVMTVPLDGPPAPVFADVPVATVPLDAPLGYTATVPDRSASSSDRPAASRAASDRHAAADRFAPPMPARPAPAAAYVDEPVPSQQRRIPAAYAVLASSYDTGASYDIDRQSARPGRAPAAPAAPRERLLPPETWSKNREPRKPAPRPVAEPVVLAEIDLDWEPFVAEPASGVRLVDLTLSGSEARRTKLFDDAPDASIDLGDDAGLDALISRRAAASGW